MSLSYNRVNNPAASVRAYDPQTGVYTSTTANVDPRERWSANLDYDRSLGEYFRLRNSTQYICNRDHGVKTLTSLSNPFEQFLQTSTSIYERLDISFLSNGWEASANGSFTNERARYSDPSMSNQDMWEYRLGMSGKYKIKHWTFDLSGRLIGNTGYLSDMMNRDRFALDASITWKMLKSKGQLSLSAKDILDQMDEVYSSLSPTMRTENRNETFHRYLALTFTYNFDAKAKKTKK